jgi:biofilm PGA synthesis N-glycosyltransferase PgaC
MTDAPLTYSVVTPVKNEQENLPRLADSICGQVIRPVEWVIVDTGSTDGTLKLADGIAERLPFVRILSVEGPDAPTRGGPIVRAFVAGIDALQTAPDVLVKIDADVSVEPDYFERLLNVFALDPRRGLASGLQLEPQAGSWRAVFGTRSYVAGPARAYRWACLQEVMPLEERRGWDEIDAIKAQMGGWRVGTVTDIPFRHHRPEGQRDAAASRRGRWSRQGGEAHYMGYRFSYLAARALWRTRQDPLALAMLAGFVRAVLKRQPQCPDPAVRAHMRREQSLRRLPLRLRESLGRAA